jgi:hypothetical protein
VRRCGRDYPKFGWFMSQQLAGAVRRMPSIVEEFGFKTMSRDQSVRAGRYLGRAKGACHSHSAGRIRRIRTGGRVQVSAFICQPGVIDVGRGRIQIVRADRIRRLSGRPLQ